MVTFGEQEAKRVRAISKMTNVSKDFGETELPGVDFADNKALQEDLDNRFFSSTALNKAKEID